MFKRRLLISLFAAWAANAQAAAPLRFEPKEVFRIPFGNGKGELGVRLEGERHILPYEFTLDGLGRFYITDIGKHRVARFSPTGVYEMGAQFPETVKQVFAHADTDGNLWLLIADPGRGVHYGVYSPKGKSLRTAAFSQYNRFRLHVADDGNVRAILSTDKKPSEGHVFGFDGKTFLMKPEKGPPPPQGHHRVRPPEGQIYFVDLVPGDPRNDAERLSRITTPEGRRADIQGRVIYTTERGEVYTRMGPKEIRVYTIDGQLKGKVVLTGLNELAQSIRFDESGNIYQLDYLPDLPGMRILKWERR